MRLPGISLLIIIAALIGVTTAGCQSAASSDEAAGDVEEVAYGAALSGAETLSADELLASAAQLEGQVVAVRGTIREVCQRAGCWFILETESDEVVRVHMLKDDDGEYTFTLPDDVSGSEVVVEGRLVEKHLSEAEQSHYSEEGAGEAAPREYRIEADGVVVRGAAA